MIVHLPDLLVVSVIVLLEPLVPVGSTRLDTHLNFRADLDFPLALDAAGLISVNSTCDLDGLAGPGL